ncbi:hypothetical protein MUK42_21352 [Musa troglodytarum]|uniref:Uncharacterized protein n=1 Tax=Musa troglodytarum TaxID=320322 RepID=A0A9E7FPS0_9LILI|nr:hypothetical protein MUK42_21352 [Musa troglodytarum]
MTAHLVRPNKTHLLQFYHTKEQREQAGRDIKKDSPFFRSRQLAEDPLTKSSDAYPSAEAPPPPGSGPSAGDAPPLDPARRERFPMLALFRMDPSVSRTPKSFTPRLGHVRELCPSWLQWKHRRVISPPPPTTPPAPPDLDHQIANTRGFEAKEEEQLRIGRSRRAEGDGRGGAGTIKVRKWDKGHNCFGTLSPIYQLGYLRFGRATVGSAGRTRTGPEVCPKEIEENALSTQMSGICHDGRSESATSRIVHAPVEAQQQGKPSVSDFQVPADGCEEVRRLRCNVDTGTGHLGHPPHPHFCAMQATRSSGCRASTCWRVHDAPAIGVAGHLESHGEAQLGGLDNLGLQLSRTESLIPVR